MRQIGRFSAWQEAVAPSPVALDFAKTRQCRPTVAAGGDQPMLARRAAFYASLAGLLAAMLSPWASAPARAADPIKVGFSMALTGGLAPHRKQHLPAPDISRGHLNPHGRNMRP